MMLIHADFDYCRHFGDLHEPGSTGVLLLHIPNSGCPGYCLVNICFANCIKQPQRKIPRQIYRFLQLTFVMGSHLFASKSVE